MLYSSLQKETVRKLRIQGYSLNQIVVQTGIPKSTFRGWIREIALTPQQEKLLNMKSFEALQAGRKSAQKKFTTTRLQREKALFEEGIQELGQLSERDLFIVGVALYWAEGFKNKHEKRLGFCNSDPKMISIYMKWLKKSLNVSRSMITARLTINSEHKEREDEILAFWRKATGLPASSFTKTFYQNVPLKKQYVNRNGYYGVLRLHVKESLGQLLKMRGWIEGLKENSYF